MADPRVELREVKEELALVEQQLAELLDRQQVLLDRKQLLEQAIKEAANASTSIGPVDWTKSDFEWSRKLEELRNSVFKLKKWRPLQLQTMNVTLSGKDCILIMPTGGGKSLCFQLPALVSKGFTLVVSPLVSLMEDQLMALHELDVKASLLNASCTKEEVNKVQAAMLDKNATMKMLYVTPEKLSKSKRFMAKLEKAYDMGLLARIVIDEVHCCSQWGHDFRPDYKFLGVMKRQFPGVPILGLTATATNNVIQDVRNMLGIQGCMLFRASFNRHNLYYEVRPKPSVMKECMSDMQKLINSRFRGQSGIVYCFSRRDSEEVTTQLQVHGIQAGCYHADTSPAHRNTVHRKWLSNKIQVVVATIAFGMGIDKPDVRFVIHHSISKSMENYYQESGRAGRDDQPAYCILYTSFGDIFRQSTMVFTEQTGLDKLYGMVAYAYEQKQCRRTLIARHFGERWDSSKCNEMCDHCDPNNCGSTLTRNISKYGQDLLALLDNARSSDQRVTGLKLLDAWMGKGAATLRMASVQPPQLCREECEQVVAYLLLHGYIREDFHFTPYNTISYLLPGPRSKLLSSGQKVVEMTFRGKNKLARNISSVTSSGSNQGTPVSSQGGPESRNKSKPTLKVINPEKSAFVPGLPAYSPQKSVDNELKSDSKRTKVRKKMVIDSGSEDESLDFGEVEDKGLARKRSKLSNSVDRTAGPDIECITIDDDESDNELKQDTGEKKSVKRNKNSDKSSSVVSKSEKKSTKSNEKQKRSSSSKKSETSNSSKKGKSKSKSKTEQKQSNNIINSYSNTNSEIAGMESHLGDSELDEIYDAYTEQLEHVAQKISLTDQAQSSRTKFSQSFEYMPTSSHSPSFGSVGSNGDIDEDEKPQHKSD